MTSKTGAALAAANRPARCLARAQRLAGGAAWRAAHVLLGLGCDGVRRVRVRERLARSPPRACPGARPARVVGGPSTGGRRAPRERRGERSARPWRGDRRRAARPGARRRCRRARPESCSAASRPRRRRGGRCPRRRKRDARLAALRVGARRACATRGRHRHVARDPRRADVRHARRARAAAARRAGRRSRGDRRDVPRGGAPEATVSPSRANVDRHGRLLPCLAASAPRGLPMLLAAVAGGDVALGVVLFAAPCVGILWPRRWRCSPTAPRIGSPRARGRAHEPRGAARREVGAARRARLARGLSYALPPRSSPASRRWRALLIGAQQAARAGRAVTLARAGPAPLSSPRLMAATIIDGKAIAQQVRAEVARGRRRLGRRRATTPPGLATVLVGDDPASAIYVGGKQKASRRGRDRTASTTGSPQDAPHEEVEAAAARAQRRPARVRDPAAAADAPQVDGAALTALIDPAKDVDGLTPISAGLLAQGRPGLRPCTPAGVMELLRRHDVRARGRRGGGRRPLRPGRQAASPRCCSRATPP